MKRGTLFFAVDTVAFALFALLAATGVLVRYVLPPGSGHFSTLWGMDRHDWGRLHFWMAVSLMAALAIHLFFHWRWLVGMIRGRPRQGSGGRVALALVGVVAFGGLIVSPFLAPIETAGSPPHRLRTADESPATEIDGSMTLLDVQQHTGVPARLIVDRLGLPADVPLDERLGRLRRAHDFEIHDVREAVAASAGDQE